MSHDCHLDMSEEVLRYDLVEHLQQQREFSLEAFGPGTRVKGVLKHIEKEMEEVEENPNSLEEWIDIVMLGLDGAHRQGYSPEEIAAALGKKLAENINRDWPDWRDYDEDSPIEHNE